MDRYDLEIEISKMSCYSEQLNLIAKNIAETEGEFDKDIAVNAITGISTILDLHIDYLHEIMCTIFKLDQYKENK